MTIDEAHDNGCDCDKVWADVYRLKTAFAAYVAAADTIDTTDTVELLEDGTIIDAYLAKNT